MSTKNSWGNAAFLGIVLGVILFGIPRCIAAPAPAPPAAQAPEAAPETAPAELPAPEPEIPDVDGVLDRIIGALGRSDYDTAIALFDEIDPEEAETTEIRLLKASVLISAGRLREARTMVNGIITPEPDNTEALFILAAIEGLEGKAREQRQLFERILRIDDAHVGALIGMGDISRVNRSLRTAAGYYDRALAVEPDNGDALLGRADIHRRGGQLEAAADLLNRAIDLYPQWASPLAERARLYRGERALAKALADLDAAKQLAPTDYWISCDRGNVLIDMGRKRDALEEFQRAISIGPDNFLAYVYSAGIKDELGDFDGAERDYGILSRIKPDYYYAFEGLGIHKMRKGEWAAARDAFLEAYKQAPQEHTYALLAAVNWMRAERQAAPKQFLETALRRANRESLDYYMLRLFHDMTGDNDVAIRVERERNPDIKAKMEFYLAQFYDIRGNRSLADRYFLMVRELGRKGIPEWRLNEWVVNERNLAPR
jgi:tetratricopeptide (TPR) repeat protein